MRHVQYNSNLGKTCETVDRIRGVCVLIKYSLVHICTCVNACAYVSTYVHTRAQMNHDFSILNSLLVFKQIVRIFF